MVSHKDTTFTKIFVGGLPYHTTDETLRKFFEKFGDIDEAVVIADRTTGKSRGYGFVTMATKESAQEAIRDANPIIDGRRANVNLAYLGAKPRSSALNNAVANANTVLQLGAAYPGSLQSYGLQPLIYPAHTLLGHSSMHLPYNGATNAGAQTTLNPALAAAAAAAHYANAAAANSSVYDFTSATQYNPALAAAAAQLDANALAAAAASFPYANNSNSNAAAAAAANQNMVNYNTYAALAQQAIAAGAPSLSTAYQQ